LTPGPDSGGPRRRRRLGLRGELLLVLLPTGSVLLVLWLLEMTADRQVLFASLAASAFLIYLEPENPMNKVRTLVLAQSGAALIGLVSYLVQGPGYAAAGTALVVAILAMVVADVVHPPAVSTALSFAFRPSQDDSLVLFELALLMIAGLALISAATERLYRHMRAHRSGEADRSFSG
jgi:CBS-domain-containing membrane protein